MASALTPDIAIQRHRAMEREARTALQRAENIAFAAQLGPDRRAVDLAEDVVESTWRLLRHLNGRPQ
jgi:hypothetical protein